MGVNADFNTQLNDTRKRFTYFVPRDWAWQQTEIEYPSAHKKLFMSAFSYQVRAKEARRTAFRNKPFRKQLTESPHNAIRGALSGPLRHSRRTYRISLVRRYICAKQIAARIMDSPRS